MKTLDETKSDSMLKVFGDGSFNLPSFLNKLKVEYELNFTALQRMYLPSVKSNSIKITFQERGLYKTVDGANALRAPVVVVEPWGLNFKERTRTLVVNLSMSDEEIAREVAAFLDEAKKQPKPKVPSWSQVVELHIKTLYS